MNKSILSKATDELTYLALNRTAVLTNELRGVRFNRADQQIVYSQALPASVDVLVLGKEHYREENRVLPIQSRRELNKILALECAANDSDIVTYHIGDYIDGERRVVLWHCSAQLLIDKGLKPLFILPETLLLLSAKPEQLVILEREEKTFWFYNRQGHYLSAGKKGLIANTSMFKASAGLADDTKQCDINADNYLPALFAQMTAVLSGNLLGLRTRLHKMEPKDWRDYAKYCGLSAVLLLGGYFSLTSLYLQMRLDSAVTTSAGYGDQTKAIFALQNQLTKVEAQQAQLAQVDSKLGAPSVIWRLLSPLIQQGISVDQISYLPDGTFLLRGVADKDTAVLEFLNNDEIVMEPQLRAATRSSDKGDAFDISLKIKGVQ